MTDSYAAELRDLIDRAFVAEHGGRASVQMVHNSVYANMPDHLRDFLIGKGLGAQVRAYFRDKDQDGLPKRPAVNAEGIHADAALLSIEECGYVYVGYLDRIEANRQQAEKWRERVLHDHGVDLAQQAVAS